MFTFWYRWLQAAFALFVLFGLTFAVFGTTGLFSPMTTPLDHALWGGPMPAEAEPFARFTFGIIGALTLGFGELGWFISRVSASIAN